MTYKRKLSFGKIEYEDLQEIVDINEIINYTVFDDWFNFDYKLSQEEENFLTMLLNENILFMDSYLEEELKAQFIIPLINKINFFCKGIRGWYERPLKGIINNVLLHGNPDYMIARGFEKPRTPYFFIQEYKRELGDRHPKNQLLAEMMVAMQLNGEKIMRAAFIIGRIWNFVILKHLDDNKYHYFRSQGFNSLKLNELKEIYINLQAIKGMLTRINPRFAAEQKCH
ncbi:hypothetical protein PN36_07770 [Candidatus Thiomargarita nelsonii]|uniref:Uncharacterized protein n=1 Tax=Candidatus Thiomargarita nelsonii TaxID=1003181 RepID=A0A4E0RK70_9GAMM|nr:hypothetical protein PN36_07770 [Candidatus Thiomargarita nelsonii]